MVLRSLDDETAEIDVIGNAWDVDENAIGESSSLTAQKVCPGNDATPRIHLVPQQRQSMLTIVLVFLVGFLLGGATSMVSFRLDCKNNTCPPPMVFAGRPLVGMDCQYFDAILSKSQVPPAMERDQVLSLRRVSVFQRKTKRVSEIGSARVPGWSEPWEL